MEYEGILAELKSMENYGCHACEECLLSREECTHRETIKRAINLIEGQRSTITELASKIVLCAECEWYDQDGEFCKFWRSCRHPEHFCDEGIRKGEKT